MITNCPNCGAPKTHGQCDYCGTVFYDPEKVDALEKQLLDELEKQKNDLYDQLMRTRTSVCLAEQTNSVNRYMYCNLATLMNN